MLCSRLLPLLYVAAGIAQADWLAVAWEAIKLALVKYIVPFVFLFQPTLLLMRYPLEIIWAIFTAVIGTILMGAGGSGYLVTRCNILESVLLVITGILLLIPGFQTDLLGFFGVVC